ncbi:MAG: hypothetical protein CM15mP85_08040 [Rhodobacterales bacterium]|nr:MAG: hypothetical protein CM15mP85_08040 [Rhodobacterales bacterium]
MLSLSSIEPQQVGVQEELLFKAIKFAIDNESQMDRDIGAALEKVTSRNLGLLVKL